jgi:hypothetical protein
MPRASLAAVLLIAGGLPLVAQDAPAASTDPQVGKWGIGVSLSPTALFLDDAGFLPIGFNNFLIPIRVGAGTTIEPEFGLFRSSNNSGGGSSSFSNLRLGIGLLMPLHEREALRPYPGARVGVSRTSTESNFSGGSQTTKQNSWYISGVVGAQHFFSRHFSLGGEVQLTRINVGEETGGGAPPGDQSFVTTAGVVMLRWFF